MVRLSFVIPAYNEAANIGRCLDSIQAELRRRPLSVEVIVVDNASTDATGDIAGRHPGVQVVRESRKGITFARQAGFDRSTGELVANIDADTRLPVGWLDRVLAEFDRDPGLLCLSGPHRYDEAPWPVRLCTRLFYVVAFGTYLAHRFLLRSGSMVQGGNFVCRRAALARIGGFDASIQFYGEDTDIARRLHPLGRVKFTFGLPILASHRRLSGEGVFLTGLRYAVNYLWVAIFGRPFTLTSRDIRPPAHPAEPWRL
ncbi:MAG TPA: glycosyltransferase family A protein [Candidatus Sulfotelmatobacter sp.]|nr:glycosyltransferase family A protein [Candidatus Sulfotelmatobacter sp.]